MTNLAESCGPIKQLLRSLFPEDWWELSSSDFKKDLLLDQSISQAQVSDVYFNCLWSKDVASTCSQWSFKLSVKDAIDGMNVSFFILTNKENNLIAKVTLKNDDPGGDFFDSDGGWAEVRLSKLKADEFDELSSDYVRSLEDAVVERFIKKATSSLSKMNGYSQLSAIALLHEEINRINDKEECGFGIS